MSNNVYQSQPSTSSADKGSLATGSLFFVAKYKDRSVAIKRNPDFTASIASIRKALPALQSTPVIISAQFSECEDQMLEISEELWEDVLPNLKTIHIFTDDDTHPITAGPITSSAQDKPGGPVVIDATQTNSEKIVVCIQYSHIEEDDLYLPLFPASTVGRMKTMILGHDTRLSPCLILNSEQHSNLQDDKRLHEYDITHKSALTLITEFEVYLVGPKFSRISAAATIFATTQVLKNQFYEQSHSMDEPDYLNCHVLSPCQLVLSCDGEVLDGTRKIGSYPQIVPGCEIFVNSLRAAPAILPKTWPPFILFVDSYLDFEDRELRYYIPPESTILDLKFLISKDTDREVSWRQLYLKLSKGQTQKVLPDGYIIGDHCKSEDRLYVYTLDDM